jgi:hypothetical protein
MSRVSPEYQAAMDASDAINENNDCAVRAVTITTGLPYPVVHKAFMQAGRKARKGTPRRITQRVVDALGYDMTPIKITAKTAITAERDRQLQDGRVLLGMTRHLAAMIDGKLIDHTTGRRVKLNGAFRVTKRGEPMPAPAVTAEPMRRMSQSNTQLGLFS